MANTPSAKKRVRQIQRKTEVNKARKSRLKLLLGRLKKQFNLKMSNLQWKV